MPYNYYKQNRKRKVEKKKNPKKKIQNRQSKKHNQKPKTIKTKNLFFLTDEMQL